ncbi:MAG: hypothetical protein BroJett031_35690 [Betaproteobacteria bacterium]|nr:MAG: hypothetical protein BroJett031_35690 [Betaproteobacteria bacterium]
MSVSLHRLLAVLELAGMARSTLYEQVTAGLWTRPVRISRRAVAWPSGDVDALVAARIAGKCDDEVRKLVQQLHAERAAALDRVMARARPADKLGTQPAPKVVAAAKAAEHLPGAQ